MKEEKNNSGGNLAGLFTSTLTLIFIVFKFTHVIDWNWWWVLSPIWISLGVVIFILICFVIISLIMKKL